ncbi:formin-like protein 5 [Canis lupus familiaris]|uniref:formin-like protein 5 n=1 Tax=Canis lupus familiaris TaxID=9615 RepID=UPI0018F4BC94|nr:formin-like protein 5 [Canis lupus familiaris]XP_038387942.1 formin-like protein 5 [Canis lupus familiaris]
MASPCVPPPGLSASPPARPPNPLSDSSKAPLYHGDPEEAPVGVRGPWPPAGPGLLSAPLPGLWLLPPRLCSHLWLSHTLPLPFARLGPACPLAPSALLLKLRPPPAAPCPPHGICTSSSTSKRGPCPHQQWRQVPRRRAVILNTSGTGERDGIAQKSRKKSGVVFCFLKPQQVTSLHKALGGFPPCTSDKIHAPLRPQGLLLPGPPPPSPGSSPGPPVLSCSLHAGGPPPYPSSAVPRKQPRWMESHAPPHPSHSRSRRPLTPEPIARCPRGAPPTPPLGAGGAVGICCSRARGSPGLASLLVLHLSLVRSVWLVGFCISTGVCKAC